MNVLGVGSHFDDLELGCSGALIKHAESGDKVYMVVVADSAYKSPQGHAVRSAETALEEGRKASEIIGAELICLNYKTLMIKFDEDLTRKLMDIIQKLKVGTIYSHWESDIHRDHQNVSKATMMAGRHVPRYFVYRSNFYDTVRPFTGTYYTDITKQIDKKILAIKAYKSELERVRYSWLDFVINQNENDGQKIGVRYAERFHIIRYLG